MTAALRNRTHLVNLFIELLFKMPRDGFWPQWYSLEQEEVPTLMELLFYWEIETNKQEVICNSKR